jgi:hypothetical protein
MLAAGSGDRAAHPECNIRPKGYPRATQGLPKGAPPEQCQSSARATPEQHRSIRLNTRQLPGHDPRMGSFFYRLLNPRPQDHKSGVRPSESVLQSCNFAHGRQRFGVRWQSAAATPLFERGPASESGVALRFPPHSKPCGRGASRAVSICVHLWFSSAHPASFSVESTFPCN